MLLTPMEPHRRRLKRRIWGLDATINSVLPTELLQLIFLKLTNISDIVRFRAVCKLWKSVAAHPSRRGGTRHPMLLMFNKENHLSDISMFDIPCIDAEYKSKNIVQPLTEVHNSTQGFLVCSKYVRRRRRLFLVNPLFDFLKYGLPAANVRKVVLSSSPWDPNCTAMALSSSQPNILWFCQPRNYRTWKNLVCRDSASVHHFEDVIYCETALAFFALTDEGKIFICSLKNSEPTTVQVASSIAGDYLSIWRSVYHHRLFNENNYMLLPKLLRRSKDNRLFKSSGGDLLLLLCVKDGFRTLKLDWDSMVWNKVTSLGGDAVLLSDNNCIPIAAKDLPGEIKGDSIYYFDGVDGNLWAFDLMIGLSEKVQIPFQFPGADYDVHLVKPTCSCCVPQQVLDDMRCTIALNGDDIDN